MPLKEDTILLSSGHRMPNFGLGTWQSDDEACVQTALEAAVDAGYRLIDTAFAYQNEKFIGSVLKRIFDSGKVKREEMFITTKLPLNGMRPDSVDLFFKTSLASLQLEYVDLYLLHFPVPAKLTDDINELFPTENGDLVIDKTVDLLETWHAMETLVDRGLVKSIGICNLNSEQIKRIFDGARIKPSNLQVECHPYLPQNELVDLAKEYNMSVTAYSPLGTPGLPEYVKKKYGADVKPDSMLENEKLQPIATKHKKTPAQVVLRFLVQRGIIPIPKSSNPNRIKENIEVFDFTLDEEDMEILKSMNRNKRYFDFASHPSMISHPEYPFKIPY